MTALALACVVAAALWLIAVAMLMALRPALCLQLFSRMTTKLENSNWRVQLIEQGLRILAGAALVIRAPLSKVPTIFEVAGWLLIATSVIILVAPISWHGRYGAFWARRLTPTAVRWLSPFPALLGTGLIYAAV